MAQTEKDTQISNSSECDMDSSTSEGNSSCLNKVKDEPDLIVTFEAKPEPCEDGDAVESRTSGMSDPHKVRATNISDSSECNKGSAPIQYNNSCLIKDEPDLTVTFAKPDPCEEGDIFEAGTSSKFEPHEVRDADKLASHEGRDAGNSSPCCPLLENIKQENMDDESADCSQYDPEFDVKVEPCYCENVGDCEACTVQEETYLPPNFNIKEEECDHADCNCEDTSGGQKQESPMRPRDMTPELRKQHKARLARLRRAKMTVEKKERTREQKKLQQKRQRVALTEEEKEIKREQERRRMMTMTEEKKEVRRQHKARLARLRRAKMTEEEREIRRKQSKLRQKKQRVTLTEEEKEIRREQLREKRRMISLTEEEKEVRREREKIRRMTMTEEKKEVRRERERRRRREEKKEMAMKTEEEKEMRRKENRTQTMTMVEEIMRREQERLQQQKQTMTMTKKEMRQERDRLRHQKKKMMMTEEEKEMKREQERRRRPSRTVKKRK